MANTGIYYRRTAYSQRMCLFKLIEESGNISETCEHAKLCRGTYYTWKERFETYGYEGLRETKSHAPHNRQTIDPSIEKRIVNLKRKNPTWGKKRIAQQIWKENNWISNVAINTVKNVLSRHDMWKQGKRPKNKNKTKNKGVTADKPNKTINIDFCFIPAEKCLEKELLPLFELMDYTFEKYTHNLIIKDINALNNGVHVFSQTNETYDKLMDNYIIMREKKEAEKANGKKENLEKKRKADLNQKKEKQKIWRRDIRDGRKTEDSEWNSCRNSRREYKSSLKNISKEEKRKLKTK